MNPLRKKNIFKRIGIVLLSFALIILYACVMGYFMENADRSKVLAIGIVFLFLLFVAIGTMFVKYGVTTNYDKIYRFWKINKITKKNISYLIWNIIVVSLTSIVMLYITIKSFSRFYELIVNH